MKQHTEMTIEEKVCALIDRGMTLEDVFRETNADEKTRALFSVLGTLGGQDIDIPPREVFRAMIEKTKHTLPEPSPFAPIQSIFSFVRAGAPFLLGVLILLSGIGIQAGIVGRDVVREEVFSGNDTATSASTNASTLSSPSQSTEQAVALENTDVMVEDYDAYFTDESDSLMSLSSAYDVSY